jgi:hypothetical protein
MSVFSIFVTVLPFVIVAFFFIFAPYIISSHWKRLLSVIDGKISKKLMRGENKRCLMGTWQGQTVEVGHIRTRHFVDFYITLYSRYPLPCPTIFILPFPSPVVSDIITGDLNTFTSGRTFEIPEFNIKIISKAADNQQLLDFITPQRLQILYTIFSKGFNRIEIHLGESSQSYIRVGYQYQKSETSSKAGLVYSCMIKPDTVNSILTQLKEF